MLVTCVIRDVLVKIFCVVKFYRCIGINLLCVGKTYVCVCKNTVMWALTVIKVGNSYLIIQYVQTNTKYVSVIWNKCA